jgi:hypothetical protein
MLVYDITNPDSIKYLSDWIIEIEKYAGKNVYKMLVGNKDVAGDIRKISFDEGKQFADSY